MEEAGTCSQCDQAGQQSGCSGAGRGQTRCKKRPFSSIQLPEVSHYRHPHLWFIEGEKYWLNRQKTYRVVKNMDSRPGVVELWPMNQHSLPSVFVNKVSVAHSHTHSFT